MQLLILPWRRGLFDFYSHKQMTYAGYKALLGITRLYSLRQCVYRVSAVLLQLHCCSIERRKMLNLKKANKPKANIKGKAYSKEATLSLFSRTSLHGDWLTHIFFFSLLSPYFKVGSSCWEGSVPKMMAAGHRLCEYTGTVHREGRRREEMNEHECG